MCLFLLPHPVTSYWEREKEGKKLPRWFRDRAPAEKKKNSNSIDWREKPGSAGSIDTMPPRSDPIDCEMKKLAKAFGKNLIRTLGYTVALFFFSFSPPSLNLPPRVRHFASQSCYTC